METKALIVIDVQKGFEAKVWGTRNNQQFESNAAKLIEAWRESGRPLIHIQHLSRMKSSPLAPGQSGVDFMDFATPKFGERIFQKHVNSAFIGTGLEDHLRHIGATELTIIGLSTDHCVSTTTRMAANMGFKVLLPHDAIAAWERVDMFGEVWSAETVHRTALASLNNEFATLSSTDSVIQSMQGENYESKSVSARRSVGGRAAAIGGVHRERV